MFKVGDRVKPTDQCRKVWPKNNYGDGIGTVEELSSGFRPLVRWDNSAGSYFYQEHLLELEIIQLEND